MLGALAARDSVRTIAGSGTEGAAKRGKKSRGVKWQQAGFTHPLGVVLDPRGKCAYVADGSNQCIRKVDLESGIVTVLAGMPRKRGTADGAAGKGKKSSVALFDDPCGLALDDRLSTGGPYRLIVAETGSNRIRAVTLSHPVTVSTVLDSWQRDGSTQRLKNPTGVDVDAAGNIYIADCDNHCVWSLADSPGAVPQLTAGEVGRRGWYDGPAHAALFSQPYDVAAARDGSAVFISDYGNRRVRCLYPSQHAMQVPQVLTLAGDGSPGCADSPDATLDNPCGLCLDEENAVLYLAQEGCANMAVGGAIRGLTVKHVLQGSRDPRCVLATAVGAAAAKQHVDEGAVLEHADGGRDSCHLVHPRGVAVVTQHLAGRWAELNEEVTLPIAMTNLGGRKAGTGKGGDGRLAASGSAGGNVAFLAAGSVLFTDEHALRHVAPGEMAMALDGLLQAQLSAGAGAEAGQGRGEVAPAGYRRPRTDSQNQRWGSPHVDGVLPRADGGPSLVEQAAAIAGAAQLALTNRWLMPEHELPGGTLVPATPMRPANTTAVEVCMAQGVVYTATNGRQLMAWELQGGGCSVIAGNAEEDGYVDGVGADARFSHIAGISYDAEHGYLLLADAGNHAIRCVELQGLYKGRVATIAGTGSSGHRDGLAAGACFHNPHAVVTAGSCLVVADTYNHCMKRIRWVHATTAEAMYPGTAGGGEAGDGTDGGYSSDSSSDSSSSGDSMMSFGAAMAANSGPTMSAPSGAAPQEAVARRVMYEHPLGLVPIVETISGVPGELGDADGAAESAEYSWPTDVVSTASGEVLFIADKNNHRIRRLVLCDDTSALPASPHSPKPLPGRSHVDTVAGTGTAGCVDGVGTAASLYSPNSLVLDEQHRVLWVGQVGSGNRVGSGVRMITLRKLASMSSKSQRRQMAAAAQRHRSRHWAAMATATVMTVLGTAAAQRPNLKGGPLEVSHGTSGSDAVLLSFAALGVVGGDDFDSEPAKLKVPAHGGDVELVKGSLLVADAMGLRVVTGMEAKVVAQYFQPADKAAAARARAWSSAHRASLGGVSESKEHTRSPLRHAVDQKLITAIAPPLSLPPAAPAADSGSRRSQLSGQEERKGSHRELEGDAKEYTPAEVVEADTAANDGDDEEADVPRTRYHIALYDKQESSVWQSFLWLLRQATCTKGSSSVQPQ